MRVRCSVALAAALLPACAREDHGVAQRLEQVEQGLRELQARQELLLAELREHGLAVRAEAPADDAARRRRSLEDLDAALGRLASAKETLDNERGQSASEVIDRSIAALQQDREHALPELLALAEAAPPARQAALLECYGRVGGAAVAPELLAIVQASSRPGVLRVAAARTLLAVDPAAGVPAVAGLLREAGELPEAYLLVHLVGATARPEAMPVLVEALRASGDRSVRCHAATGLGAFREPASVDALTAAATGDEYPAVRVNALRALARAAAPEHVREVATRVGASDDDPGVRKVARELAPAAQR